MACSSARTTPSTAPPASSSAFAARQTPFLVLTNNSIYTRRDLSARLARTGIDVPEDALWTSALDVASRVEGGGQAGLADHERGPAGSL
jgi:hypothetical protein